jgi:Zn finger protein HypA/HybF involved in hydrogenase expression
MPAAMQNVLVFLGLTIATWGLSFLGIRLHLHVEKWHARCRSCGRRQERWIARLVTVAGEVRVKRCAACHRVSAKVLQEQLEFSPSQWRQELLAALKRHQIAVMDPKSLHDNEATA